MAASVIQISNASVKFGSATLPIVPASLTEYQCQVTEATIQATSNTTTTSVVATFCQAASEATVPVSSSFQLVLDWLQDWTLTQATSLSSFMFKADAEKRGFALYLSGSTNPSATGVVTCVAGNFGGAPGEPLMSGPVSLNIDGYPTIMDSAGASIRGFSTGATAGIPGTWTPAGSTPPTTVANLIAGTPNTVTANPTSIWTTGQYMQTGTAGAPGQAYWNGTAWVAGVKP
jgi:hypothetical protein